MDDITRETMRSNGIDPDADDAYQLASKLLARGDLADAGDSWILGAWVDEQERAALLADLKNASTARMTKRKAKQKTKPKPPLGREGIAREMLHDAGCTDAYELSLTELRMQARPHLKTMPQKRQAATRRALGIDHTSDEARAESRRSKTLEAAFFIDQGMTIDDACELVGLQVDQYSEPGAEQSIPAYLPTPAQIKAGCDEIRAGWSDVDYRHRAGIQEPATEITMTSLGWL